jgi:hypothetical protein
MFSAEGGWSFISDIMLKTVAVRSFTFSGLQLRTDYAVYHTLKVRNPASLLRQVWEDIVPHSDDILPL